MKNNADIRQRRDRMIAGLLRWGTWFASMLIAMGMLIGVAGYWDDASGYGKQVAVAGIAVFILLPVMRVGLMLVMFLRERDYAYAVISSSVLAIILASSLIGLWWN